MKWMKFQPVGLRCAITLTHAHIMIRPRQWNHPKIHHSQQHASEAASLFSTATTTTAVVSFPLRKLSFVTLALLVSSQCLTFTVYQAGLREHQQQQQQFVENEALSSLNSFHFITHWQVRDNYPHDTKRPKCV